MRPVDYKARPDERKSFLLQPWMQRKIKWRSYRRNYRLCIMNEIVFDSFEIKTVGFIYIGL